MLRFLSFSFIPAMFVFVKDERLAQAARREDMEKGSSRFLKRLAEIGTFAPKKTVFIGAILLLVSITGMTRITVNNNMVEWFKI